MLVIVQHKRYFLQCLFQVRHKTLTYCDAEWNQTTKYEIERTTIAFVLLRHATCFQQVFNTKISPSYKDFKNNESKKNIEVCP